MADTSQSIRVDKLKELRAELKSLDGEWPKQLRLANKAAADVVTAGAKSSFSARGGVAPKAARSVRSTAGQLSASVAIGGKAYPYALGAEFGSVRFKQFPAWRGSGPTAGYSLYPTIRESGDEVVDAYANAVDDLTRRAFPD